MIKYLNIKIKSIWIASFWVLSLCWCWAWFCERQLSAMAVFTYKLLFFVCNAQMLVALSFVACGLDEFSFALEIPCLSLFTQQGLLPESRLLSSLERGENIYIVTELCPGGKRAEGTWHFAYQCYWSQVLLGRELCSEMEGGSCRNKCLDLSSKFSAPLLASCVEQGGCSGAELTNSTVMPMCWGMLLLTTVMRPLTSMPAQTKPAVKSSWCFFAQLPSPLHDCLSVSSTQTLVGLSDFQFFLFSGPQSCTVSHWPLLKMVLG